MSNYIKPKWRTNTFTCPHCNTLAQMWWKTQANPFNPSSADQFKDHVHMAFCYSCKRPSIWTDEKMVYPPAKGHISPNEDMPKDAMKTFNEAESILNISPRASCMLMRLCLEQVLENLKIKGDRLYDKINNIAPEDSSLHIFLEACRLAGNDYVHNGKVSSLGCDETAINTSDALATFINEIVEQLISRPKRAEEIRQKFDKNRPSK